MKKITIILVFAFATHFTFADDSAFVKVMEETLAMMDTAKSEKSFMEIANKFERIAQVQEDEWLPYYYSAYNRVIASYICQDKDLRDQYLDKAMELVKKSQELNPEEVENLIMQAYVTNAKLSVKPASRGRSLEPKFDGILAQAKKIDEENPRIYYLQGQSKFYTPAMWGGGKKKALPLIKKAIEKYDNFKPKSSIHPNWGRERTKQLLKECK